MKLLKELLRVGTFHPPGNPAGVTFTREDLAEMHRNSNTLIRSGWTVPMGWEHHPDLLPKRVGDVANLSAADKVSNRAQFHVCDTQELRLSPDGNTLFAVQDVPEENVPAVQRVGFVSPGLKRDWQDGDGITYPGWSVVHVAVTRQPVNNRQEGFVALSLPAGTLCLSLADLEGFSMADENATETTAAEDAPAESETVQSNGKMSAAIDMLASMGLMLGDDANDTNFIDRLIVAGETWKATQNAAPDEDKPIDTGVGEPPADASAAANSGSLTMSMNAMQAKLIGHERTAVQARITKLAKTGRIAPVLQRKLEAELKTCNLSLAEDGSLASNKLLDKISAYEELTPNSAFAKPNGVNLSTATPVEPPPEPKTGPKTAAEVDKNVDEFFNTSRPGRVKSAARN